MQHTPEPSETGEILLDARTINRLRKQLCDWTNMIHPAVMFEVRALVSGLPTTREGLEQAREASARSTGRWARDSGPMQRRLINALAQSSLSAHLDDCEAGSGRLAVPTARVLDEFLPKRTTRDTYFRVPDEHGDVPAGLTLDYDSLVWHSVACGGRPASAARTTAPLAVIAFNLLASIRVKPGLGGEITASDGSTVLTVP